MQLDSALLVFAIVQVAIAVVGWSVAKRHSDTATAKRHTDTAAAKRHSDTVATKRHTAGGDGDANDDDGDDEALLSTCDEFEGGLTRKASFEIEDGGVAGAKTSWGAATLSKWGSPATMESNRRLIVQEIIETEKSYLRSLQLLRKRFIEPMQQSVKDRSLGVSQKDVERLAFSSVDMILRLHESFLPQLQASDNVGETFCKFGDFFKMYTAFVNAYDGVLAALSALKKCKKFQAFADRIRREDASATLESYLIMPVQRVPRYLLLLNELQKHTPKFHTDFANIEVAAKRLKAIAAHINASKQRFESAHSLLNLQNRISGYPDSLMLPSRTLLREGKLKLRSGSGNARFGGSCKSVVALLFNDMLMVVSSSYKFLGDVSLAGAVLDRGAADDDSDRQRLAFAITGVSRGGGSVWTCRLMAPSDAAKATWCDAIDAAVHAAAALHTHA